MTSDRTVEWSVAERREARRMYRVHAVAMTVLALVLPLTVLGGETGLAVFAGAGLLVGAFNLVRVRRRGVFGTPLTARRYRTAATVAALIGLALVAYAVLYAIDGMAEPALVFGTFGVVVGLVFARVPYVNARFVEDAAAAVDPEPVRAVCAEAIGPLPRDDPPSALVLTDTRVAQLRGSGSGVSEVDSIAIADIARMDATLGRRGASLVLHGEDTDLAVHRVPAPQVHSLYEALRGAGVLEGE